MIAPAIGGVTCSKANLHPVDERIGGAPSVLFDSVALIPGGDDLTAVPAAKAFPSDAYVHCKFVGWSKGAKALVDACGLAAAQDVAFCALTDAGSAQRFVDGCRHLRHWPEKRCFKRDPRPQRHVCLSVGIRPCWQIRHSNVPRQTEQDTRRLKVQCGRPFKVGRHDFLD